MLGIEHPAIYVSDLEKSIDFYKKLGFKILRKTARPHAMMYLGTDILEIIPSLEQNKRDGFRPPYPYHIGLYTDDIDEDIRRLNAQGIKTGPVRITTRKQLQSSQARVLEHAEPEPSNPKLLGCMIPSEDENKPWKTMRFEDPDGITVEIWQRNR
jgi:catechol 2,3-dioxygenase-like lactoylglutathione lyase family enzyme